MLQIVFWSILFGVALTQVRRPAQGGHARLARSAGRGDVQIHRAGDEVRRRSASAPPSPSRSAHSGLGVLKNLGVLILTLYAALVVFMLVVLLPVAMHGPGADRRSSAGRSRSRP